MKYFNNFTMF